MNIRAGDAVKVFKGKKLVDAGRVLDFRGLLVGTTDGQFKVNGKWVNVSDCELI